MTPKQLCSECTINQNFGRNANWLYRVLGLKGHNGTDMSAGYGSAVYSPVDFTCTHVLRPGMASDGYTVVSGIVDDGVELYEFSVGHLKPIAEAGNTYRKGDVVGTENNAGPVWQGSTHITLAMQANGDKRGAHRHYAKRPLRRVNLTSGGKEYILGSTGAFFYDTYYYEVFHAKNGYSGYVDITLPWISQNVGIGAEHYQVYSLQRYLGKIGIFTSEPTGYFGPVTLEAVKTYQTSKGINPTGYVGPLTRESLLLNK